LLSFRRLHRRGDCPGSDFDSARQDRPPSAAAVLLAAGLSRRMGTRNKLLIEIGGEPMVRRVARVYLAAGAQVRAVVGYQAERVREALKGLPLTIVENPRFSEGRVASVRAGIASLTGRCDAVLIALADQAALTPGDIAGLLGAFGQSGRDRIMIPFHGGARGNPVVFPPSIIEEIVAAGPGADCRTFIDANAQRTCRYEGASSHFVTDIDTPDDLRAFDRHGLHCEERAETAP
jgi:molybdenum cofactor cytidylyltransferase